MPRSSGWRSFLQTARLVMMHLLVPSMCLAASLLNRAWAVRDENQLMLVRCLLELQARGSHSSSSE
eukprot:7371860-Prorocentrum_lima.AAC.1